MAFKGLRLHIIIPVAVLSFILLLLGQRLYYQSLVLNPLLKGLQDIEGVERVEVVGSKGKLEFLVFLGKVDNLASTYMQIDDQFMEILSEGGYRFSLQDRRDQKLKEVYHHIHFAIFEAITQGSFTRLAAIVDEKAQASGLQRYLVSVDEERVYLQLHLDDAYLYEVIPRVSPSRKGGE